jgi:hypothetical protein
VVIADVTMEAGNYRPPLAPEGTTLYCRSFPPSSGLGGFFHNREGYEGAWRGKR